MPDTANHNATPLVLDGRSLTLADVAAVARGERGVTLAEAAWGRIDAGRRMIERILREGRPAYGVTTGVGSQKDFMIGADAQSGYSALLARAHATRGPGRSASAAVLRAALAIQINLFATGATGVRRETVAAFVQWLDEDDWPNVRLDHSVGAADLTALGQLADGFIERFGADALAPKEGLTFLNSNCLTLANGALVLADLSQLLAAMNQAAAFSLEGFRGQVKTWSEGVDRLHPQAGQAAVGAHLRQLLADSRLWQPDEPRYLQDPLSLRCVPQLHGACYQALEWARSVWQTEINAVVDNPAVDLATGDLVAHGNMEITPLAVAMDGVRSAFAKAIEAAGERLQKTQWPAFTGLPVGLAAASGVASGVQFLNLEHLAGAYVAACKAAAMPAAPHYRGQLSDGVEDIASMAPMAASEGERLAESAWSVAAIETIVGVWAIDRRRLPCAAIGAGLRRWFDDIRPLLPIGVEGRQVFDIEPIEALLRQGIVTP